MSDGEPSSHLKMRRTPAQFRFSLSIRMELILWVRILYLDGALPVATIEVRRDLLPGDMVG